MHRFHIHPFIFSLNQEPTFNIKQCEDDTYISVVEILSEADVARKPCKVSTCLSVPEQAFLVGGKENFVEDLEIVQDYVLLKNNDTIPCFRGNNYMVRDLAFSHLTVEKLNRSPSLETTTNILNHSYLLLSEQPELHENHSACRYTNLEITARSIITNGE